MASVDQAQDTIGKTEADDVRSVDTHGERPDLPGTPIHPKDHSTHQTNNRAPATLFAKVVGIRR